MFRKFYDAVPEGGGGASAKVFGEEVPITEIYDSMKQENPVEVKEVKEEKKDEVKQEVKTDIKTDVKDEVKEEKKIDTPAAPDWKEIVKKQDRKEILALLELDEESINLSNELKKDEFVNKLVTYRKQNGNLTPFIEAATKDWDKVDHLDLLRDDLKRQYPNLSKEKFEILSKNRIDKRFILGADAPEDEAELASVELETEAEKIRLQRKTEQQQFLDNVKLPDKSAEAERIANEQKLAQESAKQELEQFSKDIDADPFFVKLNSEKKIVLGSEGNQYSLDADPSTVKEPALSTSKFFNKFWSKGEGDKPVFDLQRWAKVMTYAENPTAFEDKLINHGRSLETKKVTDELENVKEKTNNNQEVKKKSLAKAFAEEGKEIMMSEIM